MLSDVGDAGDAAATPSNLGAAKLARTVKLVKFLRMTKMLKMLRLLRLAKVLQFMFKEGGAVKNALDYVSVALAEHTRKLRGAALVVCPLSVLSTWCTELKRWAPSLETVKLHSSDPDEREHVTLFVYRRPERFSCAPVVCPSWARHPELRITVDELPDLEVVRRIVDGLGIDTAAFGGKEVLSFLISHPEIAAINRDVVHRHGS